MAGVFDFKPNYDTYPVGAIVYADINLETATQGKYLLRDGRDLSRGSYPELAQYFPVGVFVPTARSFAAVPPSNTVAADSVNFLACGDVGTNALQASADGITWVTTTGVWAASTTFPSIIVSGTRWVIAPSAGESQPYVIATGGTAANLVVKANWTVTTGGGTSSLTRALAGDGTGVTVLCRGGTLATASALYKLDSNADTSWTAASGGSNADRIGIVYTGQRYFCMTAGLATTNPLVQVSTDGGTTFADSYPIPFPGIATDLISDGGGTIVVIFTATFGLSTQAGFLVSKDHGVNWRFVALPSDCSGAVPRRLSYVNGRYVAGDFAGLGAQALISTDGLVWFTEPIQIRGILNSANNKVSVLAFKAGVYLNVASGGNGITATEDTSKFRLPLSAYMTSATVETSVRYQSFIKARSN